MRWDEEETCLDDETDCLNGDPMALNGDVTFSGDEEVANGEARRSCSEREGEDISRLEEELVEDESCVGFAGDTNGFLIPLGFGFEFALGGSELGTLEEDEGENAGGGELEWFAWAWVLIVSLRVPQKAVIDDKMHLPSFLLLRRRGRWQEKPWFLRRTILRT